MPRRAARFLASAAATACLLLGGHAHAQAQRWSAVAPGILVGAEVPYNRFAAADSAGNLYIAAKRSQGAGSCFVVLKYTTSGSLAWTREICSAERETAAKSVAIDPAGDAF